MSAEGYAVNWNCPSCYHNNTNSCSIDRQCTNCGKEKNSIDSDPEGTGIVNNELSNDSKSEPLINSKINPVSPSPNTSNSSIYPYDRIPPYKEMNPDPTPYKVAQKLDGPMSCIIPNWLYLGARSNAANEIELRSAKITHILNVSSESPNFWDETHPIRENNDAHNNGENQVTTVKPLRIKYMNIPILDTVDDPIEKHFVTASDFIYSVKQLNLTAKQAKQPAAVNDKSEIESKIENKNELEEDEYPFRILVHCVAGISRSTSMIIAYFLRYEFMPLDKIVEHIHSIRDRIHPNPQFLMQLGMLEEEITKKPTTLNKTLNSAAAMARYNLSKAERKKQSKTAKNANFSSKNCIIM